MIRRVTGWLTDSIICMHTGFLLNLGLLITVNVRRSCM